MTQCPPDAELVEHLSAWGLFVPGSLDPGTQSTEAGYLPSQTEVLCRKRLIQIGTTLSLQVCKLS